MTRLRGSPRRSRSCRTSRSRSSRPEVPRRLPPRHRHHADLAVPAAAALAARVAALPAGAGRALRQRGLLVHRRPASPARQDGHYNRLIEETVSATWAGTSRSTPRCTTRPRSSGGVTTGRRTTRSSGRTIRRGGCPTCTESVAARAKEGPRGTRRSIERAIGGTESVAMRVFDGSRVGPADARSPSTSAHRSALSYIATARATSVWPGPTSPATSRSRATSTRRCATVPNGLRRAACGERLRLLRELGGVRLLRPPPRPAQEVRLRGRLHSKARDQAAISHHYDVSNRFYEWLLGPSMTYTCAVYPNGRGDPGGGAVRQVRPGRPQARRCGQACACSTWVRLGRHGDARRAATTAYGRSASPCPAGRPSGRRRPSPRPA